MTVTAKTSVEWKSSGTTRAVQPAIAAFLVIWLCLLPLAMMGIVGLAFAIGLIIGFLEYVYGRIMYSKFQYCILPDKILLKDGIVSKNILEIPMIRIQGVRVDRTILERWMGLGSLQIDTAGSLDLADAGGIYMRTWIYSIKDYEAITTYILERSEQARLASDVPRMMASSPDPETVRAVNDFELGISRVFGPTDEHLEVAPIDVMNRKFHMSPRMKMVWTLETCVTLVIAWAFLCLSLLVFPSVLLGLFIVLLLALVLVAAWSYATANFNNYTFHFDRDALTVRHGILNKNNVKLPYKRIQNINVYTSFFGRMLGLHSIVVETGAGLGYIHGIEDPDPVVNFLLEQAEDARFDDALGDASELEDYHIKLLRLAKKINYRLKEHLGNFDNPFDARSPEVKGEAVMNERTERYLIMSKFLGLIGTYLALAILISPFVFLFELMAMPIGTSHPNAFGPLGEALFWVPTAFVLILLALLPVFMVYADWYGKRMFRSYRLRFDYDSFFSRYGVWTISDEMIPYRRLQNAYVNQGLLERFYGIRSVAVHAPGVYRSFPGIRDPEALVAFILRKAEEARVDESHDMNASVVTEIARELKETDGHLNDYLSKKPSTASRS
jgi:membrane protein YdbS with pleckstrin-like domain